jgi:hypothetical protein
MIIPRIATSMSAQHKRHQLRGGNAKAYRANSAKRRSRRFGAAFARSCASVQAGFITGQNLMIDAFPRVF